MKYEKTKVKNGKSSDVKQGATDFTLRDFDTSKIIWFLIKKHKFSIVTLYAILLTVYLFMPFLFTEGL